MNMYNLLSGLIMEKFRCEYCGRIFKTEGGLAEHLCKKDYEVTEEDLEALKGWNIIVIRNKKELENLMKNLRGDKNE